MLSAQPDERSMMTFVAHVFNCLLHPQETKATKTPTPQLVPTHKKGKFQELMGQVGISPDELDARMFLVFFFLSFFPFPGHLTLLLLP